MKRFFVPILAMMLIIFTELPLCACTLYAVQGSVVSGGGAIIGKNRDYIPGNQLLKKVRGSKYEYFGLFSSAKNKNKQTLRAGVNEKGLAAVSAMASCIPGKERHAMPFKVVLTKILGSCATVEEALFHKEYFLGPKFVMLADKNEIAYVEIAPEGKIAVKRIKNGTLVHTNYYLNPEFYDFNYRCGESAHHRYLRMTELLQSRSPLTFDDFITFSQDCTEGADNSIWRTGSREGVSETLASFIISLEKDGSFSAWIKYRKQPEDKNRETVTRLTSQDIFGR